MGVFLNWLSGDDMPVFSGPNQDGQLGRPVLFSVTPDGRLDRFLSYSTLGSILYSMIGAENRVFTVFGMRDHKGTGVKPTVILPKPPPPTAPAPPQGQPPGQQATMPGYALSGNYLHANRIGFDNTFVRNAYLSRLPKLDRYAKN